ncbi:pyruvate decarboxylase [Spathaspora passalidarum NRRL Y-27907]|uniref:Pyruvate decarboxylase n=1 Tax=Spathaspora passalidarum (strain NRRL Y-27907 / 11-Y1) TaxID=619300 RepID=G3AJU7_SPAPN|nr:pyruvate decarboxylase [Spathaspora passalidarum NRRL Y-27907]EGW33998.1 pyruvate decarboxylase [Spathaspora passalidarum NRRL Y-27907]
MTPVIETIQDGESSISPNNSGVCSPVSIPNEIHLGEYLFLRIAQANPKLRSIFGIPGDFNVDLLEHMYSPLIAAKDMKFVNCCNELNGAYTADGYARTIGGLSCLITTFGVGELSAINGIAGAFAEYVPVLHIVGVTTTKQAQQAKDGTEVLNYHHLVPSVNPFDSPNHDVYKNMVNGVSVIQETLGTDQELNVEKIDRVLKKIIQESRPGYLFVPADVSDILVPSVFLFMNPFNAEPKHKNSAKSIEVLDDVCDTILEKMYKSTKPSVLSDCLTSRFGFKEQLDQFVDLLPTSIAKLFTTNMARNVDETRENFIGVYHGKGSSDDGVRQQLENETDLLVTLGYFHNEVNTGAYSRNLTDIKDIIEVHPDYIKINHQVYHIKQKDGERLFTLGDLLSELTSRFDPTKFANHTPVPMYSFTPGAIYKQSSNDNYFIPQTKIIDHLNTWLKPNDLLIMETMSFSFALPDLKFPRNLQLLSANFYGSIGYALPATFGATMAINDMGSNRRIILIEGDGAAQMTIQELSSFIRYQGVLPNMPKIYLINNDGYTVERAIRGPYRSYNDINGHWKWTQLMETFGDSDRMRHDSVTLKNVDEFEGYFNGHKSSNNSRLQFYEIIAGKYDVPERFSKSLCKK